MADTGEKNYIAKESTLQNVESTMAKETTLQGVDTDIDGLVSTVNSMKTVLDTLAAAGSGAAAPISSQNFYQDVSMTTLTTLANATGKGYANFYIRSNELSNQLTVIVDGKTIINSLNITNINIVESPDGTYRYGCYVQIRFSKSITIKTKATNYGYSAGGIIIFE